LQQTVILFLGRLTRDKGILDLASAFADIAPQHPGAVLMLVGAEEDVPFTQVQEICGKFGQQLRRVGFTPFPERYMATADIFCLPSYREGFGQVIIEAGASGIPTVASYIYGITDAVEEGKSGLLFQAKDVSALKRALLRLIEDEILRKQMGAAAQARALELFSSQKITAEMLEIYAKLLN
jgi:glycosyltransferase involved in cell wall biosynthesis